ncbi:S8 family peptidase [Sphaerotilus microaerophilus]|uniref:Extracellular protease n=1 Tax=Sphaerotilus microaerophilus TaxID=2914710 RepID=A0ABM7YG35_9BURK|nr:S8 family peptidase [Sphaerotilus sp. FB-5]BDI03061.1 extracellular protease [Sphaerotilus sp. FB-5]
MTAQPYPSLARPTLRLLTLAMSLGLGSAAWAVQPPPAAGNAATAAASEMPELTDRVIVKYRNAANASQVDPATLAKAQMAGNRSGVRLSHQRARGDGNHVLRMDKRLTVDQARTLAQAIQSGDSNVEYAEPDRIMRIQLVPNDPSYASQWHYYETAGGLTAPTAWDKSTGAGITVAVIDTGYRPHADLVANIVPGYDFIGDTFVSNDGNGRDADALDPGDAVAANECGGTHAAQSSSWHGTHVAGTIAAVTNNAVGVAGVAYGAKVMPVRVLGKCGGYTSDIADAITWASGGAVSGVTATATPARVLNLSLGGSGACDTTTQTAINGARSRGTVVVVAAGNSNADAANYSPASCSGVITVAAVGRTGGRAYYSNYGASVEVAAPGGDMSTGSTNGVLSTLNTGTSAPGADSYAYYQGTSMATPHVAGVVALMLAKNSALTPDQVDTMLKSTARAFPATCSQCGAGIVNARAAVDAAMGTVVTPPPPTTTTVAETTANNNSRTAAQAITPNPALVNGSISSKTDTDYFKVTLAAGKTLTATLTPPATGDYDLYAYNAAGTQVASSRKLTGLVDSVTVTNLSTTTASTVYVQVKYYSGVSGTTAGKYTLGLSQ